jgi:hypothetical protein
MPPRWKTTRKRQLRDFPFCAWCGALATEVHHPSPGDESKLVSLCHACHVQPTAAQAAAARTGEPRP